MSALNPDCRVFRAHLAERLAGRPTARALAELSWHRHLFGCGRCRELLEREEALEMLLATLPEPRLPHHLTQRVLARLRAGNEPQPCGAPEAAQRPVQAAPPDQLEPEPAEAAGELDELLALDQAQPPEGLAERVLARLAAERRRQPAGVEVPQAVSNAVSDAALELLIGAAGAVEVPADLGARVLADLAGPRRREVELARLELLLERAGPVSVPEGLAGRVLAQLERQRGRPVLTGVLRRRRTPILAMAATLLVGLTLWATLARPTAPALRQPLEDELARAEQDDRRPAPDVEETPRRPAPEDLVAARRAYEQQQAQQPLAEPAPQRAPEAASPDADPGLLAMLDLLSEDLLWEVDALDLAASISLAGSDELLLEFGAPRTEPRRQQGEDGG